MYVLFYFKLIKRLDLKTGVDKKHCSAAVSMNQYIRPSVRKSVI